MIRLLFHFLAQRAIIFKRIAVDFLMNDLIDSFPNSFFGRIIRMSDVHFSQPCNKNMLTESNLMMCLDRASPDVI